MGILILTPIVAAALLTVSYFIRPNVPGGVKGSAYECGFIPTEGQTHSPFTVSFFIVGILFLLFDLELLLMLPLLIAPSSQTHWESLGALLFFAFLTLSLAYEIGLDVVALFTSA